MAPRRGGGGGGGGGFSSSVENRCSENGAFEGYTPKVMITLVAIYLVGLLVVFYFWGKKRGRNATVKSILRWYSYGISLLFAILSNVAVIITRTLWECGIIYREYWDAIIVGNWLFVSSKTILVIVVLLPVCSALYKMSETSFTIVKWVHIGAAALLGIVAIVLEGLSTYYNANYWDVRTSARESMRNKVNRVAVAHIFLMFFFSVSAGANIVFALFRMKRKGITLGSLAIWAPAVIFFLWLTTLIDLVEIVRYYLMQTEYEEHSGLAITGISGFSQIFTYLSILLLAASPALDAPVAPSVLQHGKAEEIAYPPNNGYSNPPIPSAYQSQNIAKSHPPYGGHST